MVVRDDDIVRRAQMWATGATIHDVNSTIGLYRRAIYLLDNPKNSYTDKDIEYFEQLRQAVYCRLKDFMEHGNYRKAREENPLPSDPRT